MFLFLGISFQLLIAEFVAIRRRIRRQIEHLVVVRTQDLHRATAGLTAVIDSSPLAIIVLDARGNAAVWNRSATVMFGYTCEAFASNRVALTPYVSANEFATALDGIARRKSRVASTRRSCARPARRSKLA
jgi:PAS domain-containing protein